MISELETRCYHTYTRPGISGISFTLSSKTGTIWEGDTTHSVLLTPAALICLSGHLSSPSTWIRFKRVTHTSLCASRITLNEGLSGPANMTAQKSFLLFARKHSQEVEEDINKIQIFLSHPMLLTVESPAINAYSLFY